MAFTRLRMAAGCLLAPLLAAGAVAATAGAASAGITGQGTVFVSPNAHRFGADQSCGTAAFKKIQKAVDAVVPGGTVVVCPGTYHEQVVLSKPVTLTGFRATIDEAGVTPAFQVMLPPPFGKQTIFAAVVIVSSHVRFSGFTVTRAQGEGILAAGLGRDISAVSISSSQVVRNDLGFGFPTPKSRYFECQPAGEIPGDCGEGVHFTGVAYSSIRDSLIAGNSGGVLLSDDTGPTHGNRVTGNVVTGNSTDCGITVPGHNPHAISATGKLQPSVAGVYDNVIAGNVVTNNGVAGEGAGVLFANASAGTASYGNLVEGNYIAGNGLSGVTMHAHLIGTGQFEDLSGNNVIGNVIGRNNLDGDTLDSPASPTDPYPTGVLVYSGGTQVTLTVARNHIFDNFYGIWLSAAVTVFGLGSNSFSNVVIPVSAGH